MTTKPSLPKILQGILHRDDESKQNHERMCNIKPQEKKRQESESSIDSAAHNKIIKKQIQLNVRNHNILTLNVNGLNFPIKRHHWQAGLKRKIQQSVVYRRPISLIEASTGLG
jgi:hypothetical protein